MSKRDAEIYREAARRLERNVYGYCCEELCRVSGVRKSRWYGLGAEKLENAVPKRLYGPFAALFRPDTYSTGFGWFGPENVPENQDARILALCFMAAIVEDE